MCQQFSIERTSSDKFPFKTVFDALVSILMSFHLHVDEL